MTLSDIILFAFSRAFAVIYELFFSFIHWSSPLQSKLQKIRELLCLIYHYTPELQKNAWRMAGTPDRFAGSTNDSTIKRMRSSVSYKNIIASD